MKKSLATTVLTMGLIGGMLIGNSAMTVSASEVKELELWHYWSAPNDQVMEAYVAKFNETHPDIQVKVTNVPYAEYTQKALVQAAAGNGPDIFLYGCNDTATLAEAGVLGPMNEIVEAGGFEERFLPLVMASHEYNDNYYGLPIYGNCLALFYNKELVPEAPTTWEELLKVCEEVSGDDCYGLAFCGAETEEGAFQFLPWLWSAGADLDSVDSEAGIKAFDLYNQLIDNDYISKEVVSWSQYDAALQFVAGRAAMMINGPWNVQTVDESAEFDYSVTVIPALNGEHASILGGESLGVSADVDMEAAKVFFDWLYSEEIYEALVIDVGQLPADKEMLMDARYQDDPIQKAFVDNLLVAKPRAYGPQYLEMSEAIQTAYSAVLSGAKEPAEATAEAASIIKPLMEQ